MKYITKIKMASGLQCFGCGAQFGIFKREHSCKNCGHIFCSSCTSNSTVIKKLGTGKHKVCFKCYKLLKSTPTQSVSTRYQTKENDLNKISEPRQNKLQNFSCSKQNIPTMNDKNIQSKNVDPDEVIRLRLLQLKDENDKTKVTDEDIGKRFEELSGRKAISARQSNINKIQPRKTETEEVSDLLTQMGDECKLDSALESNQPGEGEVNTLGTVGESNEQDEVQSLITKAIQQCKDDKSTDNDIEERLARLKDLDPSVYRNTLPDSDEDEESYNQRYLQKVLHESYLDEKTKSLGIDLTGNKTNRPKQNENGGKAKGGKTYVDSIDDSKAKSIFSKEYEADSDEDELPWCCICNANAALRCHGCDNDLYCKRCYREGHRDEDHTVSPFRPKKKGL